MAEEDDVKIISSEDEKIKLIGEIFSNDSSRKILKLLSSKEMTANEVAQRYGMSLALVTHHLKRMQAAEMIKVSRTAKSVKGQDMKYYSATKQSLLIVPPEKAAQTILSSFKRYSKFAVIGLAGLVSWITVRPDSNDSQTVPVHRGADETELADADIDVSSGEITSSDEEAFEFSEDKWSSASESPDLKVEVKSDYDLATGQAEPSHSGAEEFATNVGDSAGLRANTGSVSLDRTVYPVPFDGIESIEPLIFSIVIPVAVIGIGIFLERILTRWYIKRKAL